MSKWREIELGEVIETNKSSINREYPHSEILYLDTGSITCNRINVLQQFELASAPSRAKRLVKDLDIVYSSVRPNQLHYGIIRNPENNLVVSTGFVVITCNQDEIAPYFLYHYLSQNSTTEFLHSIAEGSTSAYPSLKPSYIEALEILLPPLDEQRAIASVLSSLDDKIDLLHRQNRTLEQMAETLFRQWFVEEADEGWEEVTLKSLCEIITKGTTPTSLKRQFVEVGINFIKVNCIDDKGNFLYDKFNFIDEETHNVALKRSILQEGDFLYSIAGTIGRISEVTQEVLPANVNQALAILRVDSELVNPYYVKYSLKDPNVTFDLHSKIVHAVQPNLSLGEIGSTLIPLPDKETRQKFNEVINPVQEKIKSNQTQIRTLTALRDTLLPKLMSGEVRVNI
ncbi:restriction endonuclease subunit S [Phaeodactylibacter xiamenensis]|uniref:restriction endonuclease subunit S n=1 Tax=Phaeodactylibacter xiamenensis TaxID=1524460 RepID=UPI003CCC3EBC